jgi:hippurate hydrolase
LASTVTVIDLYGAAARIRADTFRVYEPLLLVCGVYVAMTVIIAWSSGCWSGASPPAGRFERDDAASRILAREVELIAMRRLLHERPELAFQEHETSAFVAQRLAEWGFDVTPGIAGTGVVGTLTNGAGRNRSPSAPIWTGSPSRKRPDTLTGAEIPAGCMPADMTVTWQCCSARRATWPRRGGSTARCTSSSSRRKRIFQAPAAWCRKGLFDRFACDAVFAMHNMPGFPAGKMLFRPGPIMAAVDTARIVLHGQGGHGALPHLTADPVVAGAAIIMALQTIVARNIDPLDAAVITASSFHAGTATGIIPDTAVLELGIRSFDPGVRDLLEARIRTLAAAQAESFGLRAEVAYERYYPATVNHRTETVFAREVALSAFGAENVQDLARPFPFSEDFCFFLEEKPGCYLLMGMGDGPMLHSPNYDFNDECLTTGASYWAHLVETFLEPAGLPAQS